MYSISLPALQRSVSIPAYIKAVRLAKAHPHHCFATTFEDWSGGDGKTIVAEFLRGVHNRINTKTPKITHCLRKKKSMPLAYGQGRKWAESYQTEQMRDCLAIRQQATARVRIYQLQTPELRRRFGHRLAKSNEE